MRWIEDASVSDGVPSLLQDVAETRVTTYMGFIEYIWKGKKGLLVILFAINRYVTPLGFIVNLFAYLSPSWTWTRCEHFVRYEGSMTVIGINTTALMMLLRVSAMYNRKPLVVGFVAIAFCIEFGVNAWLLSHGIPVRHSSAIHACTMIFDDSKVGSIASASAWLPLVYDTIVLALTLKRTLGPVRNKTAGKIAKVLLRDGILYYSVIFAVNLVLTLMIATAPPGLQNITAQLEYLLTVTMMSRITLHLRKQAHSRADGASTVLRSRLRFTRSHASLDPLSVTVEETSVTHDDCGHVVRAPTEEWLEMRPPAPVRIPSSRFRTTRDDPELRFVV